MNPSEEKLICEALYHYRLKQPMVQLIRHNENITCRVTSDDKDYALRIHAPQEGFSLRFFGEQDALTLLREEMKLLLFLSERAVFPVQTPVCTARGEVACELESGAPACLLQWLEGEPLTADTGAAHTEALGKLAAQLHQASGGFDGTRLHYSHELVASMQAELQAAALQGHFSEKHFSVCDAALREIDRVMTALDGDPASRSLIHADLSFGNVLVTPRGLAPIDFSLSGYGYRVQECGMLATSFNDPAQQSEVFRGYRAQSGYAFTPHSTDAFFAQSVLLFIVAQHSRFWREEWFQQAMERWCATCFARVIG